MLILPPPLKNKFFYITAAMKYVVKAPTVHIKVDELSR